MKIKILILLCFIQLKVFSEDVFYIKVHFLMGSKPKKEFKNTETNWFGGKLGGHVGIEFDSNQVIHFLPNGNLHKIAKKHKKNSVFSIDQTNDFWEIFGNVCNETKRVSIIIPINKIQKRALDSIVQSYSKQVPYDYAFMGMRCGAATYDILSQIKVLKKVHRKTNIYAYFYPKKLRKHLTKIAKNNNWKIEKHKGSNQRKWEKD